MTERTDGDLRPPAPSDQAASATADSRRRAILDRPWTFVHQVHGAAVHVVNQASGPTEIDADALVSAAPGVALAVLGADCALLGLASEEGVIGAVHAGWRGLKAGVVEAAASQMRALGATRIVAVASPFIRAEHYPFQAPELDEAVAAFGPAARSSDLAGNPALDMEIAVGRSLMRAGVILPWSFGGCTHDEAFFSERLRHDRERHCLVVASPS